MDVMQEVKRVLDEVRARMTRLFVGKKASIALRTGQFRLSGEAHLWMYDLHSLAKLLEAAGFTDARQHSATSSSVEAWPAFHLDTQPDGSVYRPDSLYMEARKVLAP